MADITATSGLIMAGLAASPFEYSDVVITGTQGSLRGPCRALIFFRKAIPVKRLDGKCAEAIWNMGSTIDSILYMRFAPDFVSKMRSIPIDPILLSSNESSASNAFPKTFRETNMSE